MASTAAAPRRLTAVSGPHSFGNLACRKMQSFAQGPPAPAKSLIQRPARPSLRDEEAAEIRTSPCRAESLSERCTGKMSSPTFDAVESFAIPQPRNRTSTIRDSPKDVPDMSCARPAPAPGTQSCPSANAASKPSDPAGLELKESKAAPPTAVATSSRNCRVSMRVGECGAARPDTRDIREPRGSLWETLRVCGRTGV